MKDFKIDLKVNRARCWNCCRVVVIPVKLDFSTCPFSIVIPYDMKCPGCGDSIYKYLCVPDSNYIH